jgi:hypothetical protein
VGLEEGDSSNLVVPVLEWSLMYYKVFLIVCTAIIEALVDLEGPKSTFCVFISSASILSQPHLSVHTAPIMYISITCCQKLDYHRSNRHILRRKLPRSPVHTTLTSPEDPPTRPPNLHRHHPRTPPSWGCRGASVDGILVSNVVSNQNTRDDSNVLSTRMHTSCDVRVPWSLASRL